MSTAGIDAYINFSDIKGESGDESYKDWTAVKSFSLSAINQINRDNQGTGLGAGIVQISGLSLDLLFDKSAITLRQYIVKGTHIKSATLNVRRQGGSQQSWYSLALTNALIAESTLTFGNGSFYSTIVVAFQKHKESYFSQEYGTGAKGAEISYEWDSYTNKGG
ncbi:Hcp family type VI secretion system effector [Xenorhabdus hominickii]|uniref:Type VI secretion system effector (Hcp1 family) n=1 Tax=Xenorhabdus hominickii TaxID=351679 RepID=A0A2G0Q1Z2_XENHO|nr:type VI secretion system tube protein Hcp [Xenorhabdus hominickii]AOM40248.1 Type VI secretion system effector (Hcp1 family) [Xenorhabdus hominickii]PHM53243.1 type VI secretion system effector, Hcp1 family [Xenorhabdus hominickii]